MVDRLSCVLCGNGVNFVWNDFYVNDFEVHLRCPKQLKRAIFCFIFYFVWSVKWPWNDVKTWSDCQQRYIRQMCHRFLGMIWPSLIRIHEKPSKILISAIILSNVLRGFWWRFVNFLRRYAKIREKTCMVDRRRCMLQENVPHLLCGPDLDRLQNRKQKY